MSSCINAITENPLQLLLIIAMIVILAFVRIGSAKEEINKNNTNNNNSSNKNNGSKQNNTPNKNVDIMKTTVGDQDKTVEPYGWYRTQAVEQPVIERTEEQQRIVDEYFIIRNYRTSTCVSEFKRKFKTYNLFAKVLLFFGVILSFIKLMSNKFVFKEAFQDAWFVIGFISLIGGVILKVVANNFKKQFLDSIKQTIEPKKVLSDTEYEQLVNEKIASMNIELRGLEKLGLDIDQVREIRPIVLRDKVIDKDYSFAVRNTKNHSIHSSTQHVTYLYFTDEQLFVYKIQFDMCCNVQYEWASEFFYTDICDVSTVTSRNILSYDDYEFEYSRLAFNIIATNSKIGFELDGDNESIASIQAMKQKIREKKAE